MKPKRSRPAAPDSQTVILENEGDIERALEALTGVCPFMARAAREAGQPLMRRWSPGFDGLARIVVGQQLSTASANAIIGRLEARVVPLDAATVSATSDADLMACGLSRGKLATLRAMAAAVEAGSLDFDRLTGIPADEVRERLTAVRGLGPWTADIYLLFCRGDADAFPSGDLALQVAAQRLLDLGSRPGPSELSFIAERWRPWRGVAARMLWSYYALVKAKPVTIAAVEARGAKTGAGRGEATRVRATRVRATRAVAKAPARARGG